MGAGSRSLGRPGPPEDAGKAPWSTPHGASREVDACAGDAVLATMRIRRQAGETDRWRAFAGPSSLTLFSLADMGDRRRYGAAERRRLFADEPRATLSGRP